MPVCDFAAWQGYKVYYTQKPDLPTTLWTVHPVEKNSQLTTVTNLLTNRTYTMKVLAYTDVGDGPLSDPLPVTTSQIGTVLFVIFIHQNVGEHIKREKYCNNKINLNYEAMQKILT